MRTAPKTTKEDNVFYACIPLRAGHIYYIGKFRSRSAARRAWFRFVKRHPQEVCHI